MADASPGIRPQRQPGAVLRWICPPWNSLLVASLLSVVASVGLVEVARTDEPRAGSQQESQTTSPEIAIASVAGLVAQLDSPRCDERERAERSLLEWAARPELSEQLAVELRRALVSDATSFEVRTRLEPILAGLPKADSPPPQFDEAELRRLIARLEDDSYGARQAAGARLVWMLGAPEAVCPTMLALRERLADPRLDASLRRELEPVWRQARAAWLASDPRTWKLPPIGEPQLKAWIAALEEEVPENWAEPIYPPHDIAHRELLDCLARDDLAPRLKELLSEKLAQPIDPVAAYRLQEIYDWTMPGLVAEIWEDAGLGMPRIATVQYLALGVPCQPEGAERPSLFDRADDRTAHCVSGNSLSEGDWPVGIAFPNPRAADKFFHLVNTPTPRLRLAYQANVDRDEQQGLKELTRKTLERFLAEARPLSLGEVVMLDMLDAEAVSKFASDYFLAVDDQLFPADVRQNPSGRASVHHSICFGLAQRGTRAAIPGLTTAIERGRFLKATPESPVDWPWVAALAIAVHDPWPGVDQWLAGLIERGDPLLLGLGGQRPGGPPIPDLGGSAAAILLARHDLPPWSFRLERTWLPPLDNFDIPACRFTSSDDRTAVLKWWEKRGGSNLSEGKLPAKQAPASP